MENEYELTVFTNESGEIGFALVSMWDGSVWSSQDFEIISKENSTRISSKNSFAGTKKMELTFGQRESFKNIMELELSLI